MDFLRKNYVNIQVQEAQDVIREYDSNDDGCLSFDEFSQFVLPATDNYTRNVAANRRFDPHFRKASPLPYDVVNRLVRLFEKELALQRHREESKRHLALSPDFIKVRAFDAIAHGRQQIRVFDLSLFLERNGFFARHSDIEAILRRIDHDGDQAICYEDFCELTTILDPSTSGASPVKSSASPVKSASKAPEESKNDSFISPTKVTVSKDNGSKPVKSFEASPQRTSTVKKSASPTKQERASNEKAAANERQRV